MGLRQSDVAKKLGFTSSDRISEWEQGKTFPHVINLLKLSVIFNLLPHELYDQLLEEIKTEMKIENPSNSERFSDSS